MKKIYLLMFFCLSVCIGEKLSAQTIIGYNIIDTPTLVCTDFAVDVFAGWGFPHPDSLKVETTWGDGSVSIEEVTYSDSTCHATHHYQFAGTYTVKHVLIMKNMGPLVLTRVDSITYSHNYALCQMIEIKAYYDINNNCVNNIDTDKYLNISMLVKVDSANVPIDSISIVSGCYYKMNGTIGTPYRFTILPPPGIVIACPISGMILDTIRNNMNNHTIKYVGYTCSGAPGFDLKVTAGSIAGIHHAQTQVIAINKYCSPQNGVLTVNFSSKYDYQSASPTPTTVNGNTLTWNLNNISLQSPITVSADFEVPGPSLTPGDTVHSSYYITPTNGDGDPSDNTVVIVDTVVGSYDPNAKDVMPRGDVLAGTKLTYTIHFENTGNDTAHNIYVLDTLSDKVLPNTLKLIASTAVMNFSMYKTAGGLNIAKFDFPNIMLPDSSHHGLCDGMFVFSIDTKPSLAPGTYIPNRAGIYFDDNEVVMTEYAMKMIEIPNKVSSVINNVETGLYPNPVTDILNIYTDATAYSSLEISNAMGQVLIQQPLKQNEIKVNVKALPTGLYMMALKGRDGKHTMKFEKL